MRRVFALALSVSLASLAGAQPSLIAQRSYVVVVSESTFRAADWRDVVQTLRKKHDGALVTYRGCVTNTEAELREIRPRFIAFVAQPEETGRAFVVAVHRLTRRLDDDPYGDALWGIVTGHDATDALRIASEERPLVLRRGLSGFGAQDLAVFEEGIRFDEEKAGERWVKRPGQKPRKESSSADSTKELVDALNDFRPDVFMTSGHATEKDWRIGYSYPNGSFRCEKGQLYGLDTQGRRYNVNSPNPKVYLGVGNCLIGHISERDCMALALMHSAGVNQMYGYTVVTFYGYMGWGTRSLLLGDGGRYTLAEAFYLANQSLIHRLETQYPDFAALDWDDYSAEGLEALKKRAPDEDALGLLWDRDTVAFYGDPAWEVRAMEGPRPWDTGLTESNGTYTFRLTTRADGQWRPSPLTPGPAIRFPRRLRNVRLQSGEEYMPLITESFLILPLEGSYRAGEEFVVVFKAEPFEERTTAGDSPAVKAIGSSEPAGEVQLRETAAGLAPPEHREAVARALREAGDNAAAVATALRDVPPEHKAAMLFLLKNAPRPDLQSLPAAFFEETVKWAFKAREMAPWGRDLPEEVFFNGVLPYANVNERRDTWRRDFFERFQPLVKGCTTPGEAAQLLNRDVFALLDVRYHARKRLKPDQSPYESIETGYASCTGLSILLADACRSVGVPARLAGTPQWTTKRGNHTWVEVWSEGTWHFLGAAEYDPGGLDRAWFVEDAAKADPHVSVHRIYAASFQRTAVRFPLVWDAGIRYVSAEDVTAQYAHPSKEQERDVRYVPIQAYSRTSGERIAADVTVYREGDLVTRGVTRDSGHDTNDVLTAPLRAGKRYEVTARLGERDVQRMLVEAGPEVAQEVRFDFD